MGFIPYGLWNKVRRMPEPEVLQALVDAGPGSGGSSAPTDVLLLGTDVPLLNGWVAATVFSDDAYPARVYKQGGRLHVSGALECGTAGTFVALPADYAPALFGEPANSDPSWRWTVPKGAAAVVAKMFVDDDGKPTLALYNYSEGDTVWLDGISWPLA